MSAKSVAEVMMARLYRQKSEATEDTLAKVEKVVRVIVLCYYVYMGRGLLIYRKSQNSALFL